MMGLPLLDAVFLKRHNRFVGSIALRGVRSTAYIPNTGRLWELLIPGRKVLVVPHGYKHPYKLQYVIWRGRPVYIDAIGANGVFARLLSEKKVPGFREFHVARREPVLGKHRFDFLLEGRRGRKRYLEIKTCTQAWGPVAAFPDAPTVRGVEHLRALAATGMGMVVFFIMHGDASIFVPDYHTHFEFYRTLACHRDDLSIAAFAAHYNDEALITGVSAVKVRIPEVAPSGNYLLVYKNPSGRRIKVGAMGEVFFRRGFYVYAGSGRGNLFSRLAYHSRTPAKPHWHVDYLKKEFVLLRSLLLVAGRGRECELAMKMAGIGAGVVAAFGSSDCVCPGHLLFFEANPLESEDFWDMVMEERFGAVLP